MPQHPAVRTTEITQENIPLQSIVFFHRLTYLWGSYRIILTTETIIEKSRHHVRISLDFASSIVHELLQTDEIMVSIDVASLLTKVPIQLALNIAK